MPKRFFLSMFGLRSQRKDRITNQQDLHNTVLSTFINLTPSGSLLIDIGHLLREPEQQQAQQRGNTIQVLLPDAMAVATGSKPDLPTWSETEPTGQTAAQARERGLRVGGICIDAFHFDYILLQEWLPVICDDKPVLCIELPDDEDRDRALDLLNALDYVVYTVYNNDLIRFANSPAWTETGPQSLICVPA